MTDYSAHNDDGIPSAEPIQSVNLEDYETTLREVVPGAHLRSAARGLRASWGMYLDFDHVHRAVNDAAAREYMLAFGEEMQDKAIRELGIRPILEEQTRKIVKLMEEKLSLIKRLERSQARLMNALDELEELKGND